jgi:hypothetical protein
VFGPFFRKRSRKFGEIAIAKGLATEKDVRDALLLQKEYQEKHNTAKELGAILTEKGVLTPNDVKSIIEDQKKEDSGLLAWFIALFGLSR